MNINAQFQNSIFSSLFSDPDVLRELYCAIEGIDLPADTPIDINTLTDILYMEQINDISFTIDNRLVVLVEHQSTINENMPLRMLLYIARIYEKIIDRKKLYQKKLEKIPTPEFIVLYNGKDPLPDYTVLKLSDAFKDTSSIRTVLPPALELTVHVYNINKGHNTALCAKSKTLDGYCLLVATIREYRKKYSLEEAMKAAIQNCIDNNILKSFLETHSSEVFNMLLTEWKTEEAKVVWFEEGREEGLEAVARNALAEGFSIESVQKITGLDMEVIKKLEGK